MKITVEFDSDDDEKDVVLKFLAGSRPEFIVTELDQYLRGIVKYSQDKTPEVITFCEELREKLRELNEQYKCGVEF